MEDCSGVEKCYFPFEIVHSGIVWVEEVCGAEFEAWSWAFEELLTEIEEFLLEVYPDESVRASRVSSIKNELSDIGTHYRLTVKPIGEVLQHPKSTTIWFPFFAYSRTCRYS